MSDYKIIKCHTVRQCLEEHFDVYQMTLEVH